MDRNSLQETPSWQNYFNKTPNDRGLERQVSYSKSEPGQKNKHSLLSTKSNGHSKANTLNGDLVRFQSTKSGLWKHNRYSSDIVWQTHSPHVESGMVVVYEDRGVQYEPPGTKTLWDQGPVFRAVIARVLLVVHNIMSVWRVTEVYDESLYWLLVLLNSMVIVEGLVVVLRRGGIEYKWWCPCFMFYLLSTLPLIWLLQLHQYDLIVAEQSSAVITRLPGPPDPTAPVVSTVSSAGGNITANSTAAPGEGLITSYNMTLNSSDFLESTTAPSNTTKSSILFLSSINNLPADSWLIIVQESMVYLLVFCRWLLPKGEVSREFIADLLLEFLAIASDIMELLAVFDEDEVRSNLSLTYVIMAVWSASFIQFVPTLMHKRQFRHIKSPRIKRITRACGDSFVEVTVLCMGIFLQDGPFLVVRLFIMIKIQLVTYSLMFFVLKNIVTLILLTYRLALMSYRMPCCVKIRRSSEREKFLKKQKKRGD